MSKNDYIKRQQAVQQGFLDAGEQMGMQKMWDYLQIAVRCPDVMGNDILGRKRIEKIFAKCKELADHYHEAFTDGVEADYRQEELDGVLREIWGDDLNTFYERYPQLKKVDYKKSRKNWR